MDRWMHEDPKLYKYECTKHDTCKKYFKKAYSLRKHLKRMGDKDYPTNISRFFRPEIPPDQETIKDYELPPTPPPRISKGDLGSVEGVEPKKRKKKIGKRKSKKETEGTGIQILFSDTNVSTATADTPALQTTISSDVKPQQYTNHQYIPGTSKPIVSGKRGRKKKTQNITIVQVGGHISASPALSQLTSPISLPLKETDGRITNMSTYTPSM